MGRPNAVVTSPNLTIVDEQMLSMQNVALSQLQNEKHEFRKRFALMQMNDGVFILGGYVVEPRTQTRALPANDYL
jgi:hypothetical protein